MNKKPTVNNFLYPLENIISIACLTCMLIFLCNMCNEMYETLKNIWAARAFLMFTLFMCILQKVKLLNWQTLVASLLYWPIAWQYRVRYLIAPDYFNRDRVVVWIVWLALLIVVDMFVYKKVNPLSKINPTFLFVYALMSVTMVFYRNNRTQPIIFALFFLFYLIPLNQQKWERVVNQVCCSWLIAFFIMLYRSLKNNPEVSPSVGRWYGDFLNIGDFGLFVACTVTILLFKLYQIRQSAGRKNLPYVFCILCLLPVVWTVFRVSTITMFIGILFLFLMGYVLLSGKSTPRHALLRCLSVGMAICVIGVVGFLSLYLLSKTDKAYWKQIMFEGNTFLKPLANLIHRAHYMFDETRTFANSDVFAPGSLINYIDLFTSGRLAIIVTFAKNITFAGGPAPGLQVGDYYAYSAHNTYIQILYQYGLFGGGCFIFWLLYSTIASAKLYLKQHKTTQILLCIWMAITLGVFLGEAVTLYVPIVISTLLLTYPLMIKQ